MLHVADVVLVVPEIDLWLLELLRLDGRGDYDHGVCAQCGLATAEFCCEDCMDIQLHCRECTLLQHALAPLHCIFHWVFTHFRRILLKSLGLRIQLGHPPEKSCISLAPAFNDDFILIDVSGIHEISLDFCGCESAHTHSIQLYRSHFFPTTTIKPKTAATFRVLETFQLLSLQSKLSGWEYYSCLAWCTDNAGLVEVRRHLKMLKHAGRGNDPGGVRETTPESCAVLCPACPHLGKNLPEDWECAPAKKKFRWIYRLFLAIDTNFRLKRKQVSSDRNDPGLNHGYSYFVEEKTYKEHLSAFSNLIREDKSSCNDHDAIKLVQLKGSKDTAAMGIGTIECSWHDMKHLCSIGDLQKGERSVSLMPGFESYVNMDYLFHFSLRCHSTRLWMRHLLERFTRYGWSLSFSFTDICFLFLVPKFHLPAHQKSCQTGFSFNHSRGVGHTYGEALE
ncbi:hypothetical protein OBBRIDRAFT_814990 [Obba rivulosa]|uniref:CxC2-like cysteine cluster KDZ transposase-associated domain-containing protein n=1 Tax=Obba rivulosa TaxID=1052685 RepID=A0A8E2AS31_9APHY|nr:hypothetical protein OBBRIDRAFT_814990 [Obba rivulosa]